MKPVVKNTLNIVTRYILPAAISVWMIVWFFSRINLKNELLIIHDSCNIYIMLAMMVFVVAGMAIRGIRWGIQQRAVGIGRMPPVAECCAIFGAYTLNLIFPRLGEAWRCWWVSRRQHCPFSTVIGTDLGDRGTDLACVIIFFIMSMVFARSAVNEFVDKFALGKAISSAMSDVWLWVGLAGATAAIIVIFRVLPAKPWVMGVRRTLSNLWAGFCALFHMRQVKLFLWLTLGIWVAYFLQVYVCFFAFPFARPLTGASTVYGMLPGLLCLLFGTCSTIIPSNGGLGPWNIAIAYALEVYGLDTADANAFALAAWVSETLIIFATGIFAAIYIVIEKRRLKYRMF